MKKDKIKKLSAKIQSAVMHISFTERNTHFLLPLILFIAFVIRFIAFTGFSQSFYGDFPLWDERVYQEWASQILAGKLFVVHDFSPLPAYVMAAVYRLFANDPVYVRFLNIFFGVFTCLFIYLIAKDLANKTIGLLACLMAALYKPFIFIDITVLKESLGVFLFSAAIYSFVSLMKGFCQFKDNSAHPMSEQEQLVKKWRWSYGKVLFLGIIAGLLINVRQNSIVLLPVFPVFLLWLAYKWVYSFRILTLIAVAYLLGLSVAITPFLIRNYRTAGEFTAAPAGGFNFYLANNLGNPYPYYRPVPFATSIPSEQAIQFIIEASRRTERKLSAREAASYWTWEVIRIANEHPGAFARKFWQKTLVFMNQSEAEDNYDLRFTSRFIPFFQLPFFAFWFIFPPGMTVMLLRARKSHKAFALNVVFFIYVLTLIAFFSNMRIRIPLLVILIPYAAMGLNMLFRTIKERISLKDVRLLLIGLGVFIVVEFLPVQGAGDMTAHYNTHAINLASKGFRREAIKYWQESSAMEKPYSAYANLALAGIYYQEGDFQKGKVYLEKIPENSFAAADKYKLLGDGWLKQKQIDQAILAYEKSLQINAGQIEPRAMLIQLYEIRNPRKAQKEREYLKYIESFYREANGS